MGHSSISEIVVRRSERFRNNPKRGSRVSAPLFLARFGSGLGSGLGLGLGLGLGWVYAHGLIPSLEGIPSYHEQSHRGKQQPDHMSIGRSFVGWF